MIQKQRRERSPIRKRSVVIGEHKTSLTLENEFWLLLKEIAVHEKLPLHQLVARIDTDRQHADLSSAIRLYVLEHYRRLPSMAAPSRMGKH
ncbi:MAG: ribbon-helix-helix domain-containing protein [Xanthobacteraceae bacterium]